MKKRVYFDKFDDMKFISHLDLIHFFEKLIIKAQLPIKYTQGFNPRPRLSFANPVSLGTESFDEVMDFELEENLSDEIVFEKLSGIKVLGFKINRVETVLPSDKISIADIFSMAIFEIEGEKSEIDLLDSILNQEIILEKKEKNGKIVERDLKEKVKKVSRLNKNKIEVYLVNGSPNSFLNIAGIKLWNVSIKKLGYKLEGVS
ncbi:MAG: TIGR03936 family radical SAM-associated protein [Fusobacteriaceae bacterium]